MGRFLAELDFRAIGEVVGGRDVYRLLEDFGYEPDERTGLPTIWVPKGYETDLASIPRFFIRIITPASCQWAAVIHDWLYYTHKLSRAQADWMFRMALRDQPRRRKVGWLKRWAAWLVLRWFGGFAYRNGYRRTRK